MGAQHKKAVILTAHHLIGELTFSKMKPASPACKRYATRLYINNCKQFLNAIDNPNLTPSDNELLRTEQERLRTDYEHKIRVEFLEDYLTTCSADVKLARQMVRADTQFLKVVGLYDHVVQTLKDIFQQS